MRIIISVFLLFYLYATVSAQSYDILPIEFRKSFKEGVRSLNGEPGAKYWQNSSKYDIDVKISIKENKLYGKETIEYNNQSPDDLSQIVLRIYPDFSVPGKSRDWEITEKDFSPPVNISLFKINGMEIALSENKSVSRAGTNLIINLTEPIKSKSVSNIDCEWSFEIPGETFPRMGKYDSTSFMIAYWYPQISVYDDIDGWDKIDYKGQVEFYNDFSDYNVRISTDTQNECIWATGKLQNPKDVFSSEVYNKYTAAINSARGSISEIINQKDIADGKLLTYSGSGKVWHFKAEKVPDFVLSMSNHYNWTVSIAEPEPGRKVIINTASNNNSYWFKYVPEIAKGIIEFLSTKMPGVPFPFPCMTVFNGEGGMEYPMMVNDGNTETWQSTVYLTSHEISHSYFPFYMGINERKYAWMDEGFAVFLPMEFQTLRAANNPEGNKNLEERYRDVKANNVKNYMRTAGTIYDVPMLSPSNILRAPSYRHNAYSKAALVYGFLESMLGKELFGKSMKEYIKRWNGKHPTPFDFFFTFNSVSGKDLNWFWKKWFMEYGVPDLAIKNIKRNEGYIYIEIENKGGLPLPIHLTFESSGETISLDESIEVWEKNNKTVTIKYNTTSDIKKITLGNQYIPDSDTTNNTGY